MRDNDKDTISRAYYCQIYQVIWHNSHASGVLPGAWSNKQDAIKEAKTWKRGMVAADTEIDPDDYDNPADVPTVSPEQKRETEAEYNWEIKTHFFHIVHRWLKGYVAYADDGHHERTMVVAEATRRALVRALVDKVQELQTVNISD